MQFFPYELSHPWGKDSQYWNSETGCAWFHQNLIVLFYITFHKEESSIIFLFVVMFILFVLYKWTEYQ